MVKEGWQKAKAISTLEHKSHKWPSDSHERRGEWWNPALESKSWRSLMCLWKTWRSVTRRLSLASFPSSTDSSVISRCATNCHVFVLFVIYILISFKMQTTSSNLPRIAMQKVTTWTFIKGGMKGTIRRILPHLICIKIQKRCCKYFWNLLKKSRIAPNQSPTTMRTMVTSLGRTTVPGEKRLKASQ